MRSTDPKPTEKPVERLFIISNRGFCSPSFFRPFHVFSGSWGLVEPFLSESPFPLILFAAEGDKSGFRVFRLFLAYNPIPPQAFKVVDIPTRSGSL
jgi:hypothetical protein